MGGAEGPRRSIGTCCTLCGVSVTPSATHNQCGPLQCWFPSGWACARSRPLWVSPTNSPVRLGISPAATSTPTGVFNQRLEALFPLTGALGCAVCFTSLPFLLVYLWASMGPLGLLAVVLPVPFSHNPPHLWSHRTTASPLHPGCPSPPLYWSGWMFLLYLLGCRTSMRFDFLSLLVGVCF